MVIADSSTWLDYFEKDKTRHAMILETLIKEDKIVICGFTLVEILKNIKASKLVFEFKGLSLEEGLLCALSQRKNLKILTKNKEIKNDTKRFNKRK